MKKWLKICLWGMGGIVLLFVVDLICIFTINRPLLAIKEDNGHSINMIYRGLFYDTYNCHEYPTPQIKSKGTKFNCTVKEEPIYTPTEVENVSIDINDISTTGATITIKDTNKKPYVYGAWYKIEKEIDGKWYDVNPIIDDYSFTEKGYLVDKNNEVNFVIDWKDIYGELPLGSYRILKEINHQYIFVQFAIID